MPVLVSGTSVAGWAIGSLVDPVMMHPPKLKESIAIAAMLCKWLFIVQNSGERRGRSGFSPQGVVPLLPLPLPLLFEPDGLTMTAEPRLTSALLRPERSGTCWPDFTPSPCFFAVESRKLPLSGLPPNVGLTG